MNNQTADLIACLGILSIVGLALLGIVAAATPRRKLTKGRSMKLNCRL